MTGFLKNLGRICSFYHQVWFISTCFPFAFTSGKSLVLHIPLKWCESQIWALLKITRTPELQVKTPPLSFLYFIFEASDESEKDEEKIPTETRTEPVTAAPADARVTGDVITSLPDGTKSCETLNLRHLQRSPYVGLESAHVTSWSGAASGQLSPAGGPEFPSSTCQPLLVQVQPLPTIQPGNNQHTL